MTAYRHLTAATTILAAIGFAPAAWAEPEIVRLPTVHIVAQRSAVAPAQPVWLPTVVIVAKRNSVATPTLLAEQATRAKAL